MEANAIDERKELGRVRTNEHENSTEPKDELDVIDALKKANWAINVKQWL